MSSFLCDIPGPKTGPAKWILSGWQTNSIFSAQTGSPINIVSGSDRALSGTGTQRANLIGNPYLPSGRSRDEQMAGYFNPAAFGTFNLDFSIFKGSRFAKRRELQYRWEMFNVLNHANLGNPRANIGAVRPGQIDSTSAARIMQMGLPFVF